jgi:hypothetical protein
MSGLRSGQEGLRFGADRGFFSVKTMVTSTGPRTRACASTAAQCTASRHGFTRLEDSNRMPRPTWRLLLFDDSSRETGNKERVRLNRVLQLCQGSFLQTTTSPEKRHTPPRLEC